MHRQNKDFGTLKEASYLKKKKDEVTIRSSAAEYLTYVASVGDQQDSIEMPLSWYTARHFRGKA